MTLTAEQVRRYARHVLLPDVGGVGQRRLLQARVLITDASGAGAAAIAYLAAAGVGTLVIADRSVVAPADGVLYEAADCGRPRALAVRDRVAALNPDVTVLAHGDAPHRLDVPPAADPAAAVEAGAKAAGRLIRRIVASQTTET